MLNPSVADAIEDDPTIRRCVGYAKAWGCGGIDVRNLFGLRATDPGELRKAADPVGPDNDALHLADLGNVSYRSVVVAAWGVGGDLLGRAARVLVLLSRAGVPLRCLGTTAGGQPRHPLYCRGDAELVPFPSATS